MKAQCSAVMFVLNVGLMAMVLTPQSGLAAPALTRTVSGPTVTGAVESTATPAEVSGNAGRVLTLSACIEIALKKNQSIIASANSVNATESRVGEARANYYPQVSWQSGYTRTGQATTITDGVAVKSAPYNLYSSSITLNQNLIDFGKTSSQVDISKYNLASARSDLDATQAAVILSVKQAYYSVLTTKRNKDVAADVIKQFQLHLDQAKGFYDVGTKARIDVIKAEVDLSNAKLNLINVENSYKIAWVTLNNVMGVPDAGESTIEDNLSFQPYAITLEQATKAAFESRPDLKSMVAKREAAQESVGLARNGYYPVLTGSASYMESGQDFPLGRSWNAGLLLTVPLFSGFLTTHQVAEAKSQLYVLKANEESLRQQIVLEVRQAYLNLHAAEASIATAELAAKQAKENLDLANGRYSAGVGSPIEVSDAFATYVAAQANYTSALSNYKIAQANIEKATGSRE